MGDPDWGVDITFHGHSCFTLRDSLGRTVVTDPFDETIGYGRLELRADALFVTHNHFDHNYIRVVKPKRSNLELVDSTGTTKVASDLLVSGVASHHDNEEGEIHGPNRIYTFFMGGLRIAHLGDFGEDQLSPRQKTVLGEVDVLFIPVGGFVTTNAVKAKAIIDQLKPRVVFPMHYGDSRFYKLDAVSDFIGLFSTDQVINLDRADVRIRKAELTDRLVIYLLKPTRTNF